MSNYEKRGYLLENFRLFHLHSEQGVKVDFHYHDFCKLLFLVSGSGSYVVEGRRYLLRSGDVVMVGSRCVHQPDIENEPYERIILYISPEFLQKASTPDCDLMDVFSGRRGYVLRPKETARKKLFAMVAELEKNLSGEGYGRELLSNVSLLRLLVEAGSLLHRSDTQIPQPVMPQNPRILEIKQYLDGHLAEDIDIDTLANAFYISKYHMMRLFHKEIGLSVYNYLTQRRLLMARDLIGQGVRATEACYRCGFRSYSSFTRAFSKHFGSTPTGRPGTLHSREEGAE